MDRHALVIKSRMAPAVSIPSTRMEPSANHSALFSALKRHHHSRFPLSQRALPTISQQRTWRRGSETRPHAGLPRASAWEFWLPLDHTLVTVIRIEVDRPALDLEGSISQWYLFLMHTNPGANSQAAGQCISVLPPWTSVPCISCSGASSRQCGRIAEHWE